MKRLRSGGGWKAIGYSLKLARRVGFWKMWQAMRSKNACKTCAVGMGGQLGGMVNEGGYFPEVCKKSFQAMASDMQGAIRPLFYSQYDVPRLRALSSRDLEYAGRLVTPVLLAKGSKNYVPISWDDALQRIADKLRAAGAQRSFFYASGRSSMEAGFLLQLLARLFGTNYVNNCSYYCHQASGVGLASSIGTGAGTVTFEDLDHCDFYMLIGANPASNHPRLMRSLMHIRRRGGDVVVVNPLRETGLINFRVPSDPWSLLFGSEIASEYLQPHIGGDMALLIGMAKFVLEQHGEDTAFIANCTEDFENFAHEVRRTSWGEIVEQSGIEQPEIGRIGRKYLAAKNVVIGWAMGVTHHLHGTNTVQAIANLALLRGMIGRKGAGMMPIRGHSNIQGMGSVGVTPVLKQKILQRFEERLKIEVPKSPGYDTMACMEAAGRREMDVAICLGGNLYGSNPDLQFAHEAFSRIGLVVYFSTTLNTGHAWGTGEETIILPVLPRDEEPEPTTQESMFSYVRLSEGGKARYEGPRSEVSLLAEIGERILPSSSEVHWDQLGSHAAVRKLIGELVPELEPLRRIDDTKQEFHIPGRALHQHQFPTPSGKARFHALGLPKAPQSSNESLTMMTIRSEGQFNTVVYDEEDLYRGQERRDVVMLAEEDLPRLGLKLDQRVKVTSSTGELRNVLVRTASIRSGNAVMYYPEANVLVSRAVDPLSKTPAFKSVEITLTPEESLQQLELMSAAT